MKKILFMAAIACGLATAATAQSTRLITKSITGADTIVFPQVPSKIKSFTYGFVKSSGTTAGKVYFEGSNLSGDWDTLDSLTTSNQAREKKTFPLSSTSYLSYRFRFTNTSSAPGTARAMYLRRADE